AGQRGVSQGGSRKAAVSGGIVDIRQDPRVVNVQEFGLRGVSTHDFARGAVFRQPQKLRDEVAGKPDRVSAAALVARHTKKWARTLQVSALWRPLTRACHGGTHADA